MSVFAFASAYQFVNPVRSTQEGRTLSRLYIQLGWFSGGKGNNNDSTESEGGKDSLKNSESSGSAITGVTGMVDSMENFKRAQRAGKMTRKLVQELSSTTVEGTAADGKVKVIVDCQQRPVNVIIDESYVTSSDVADLCASLVLAMNDAHAKSMDRMDEKMKSFYSELGLST